MENKKSLVSGIGQKIVFIFTLFFLLFVTFFLFKTENTHKKNFVYHSKLITQLFEDGVIGPKEFKNQQMLNQILDAEVDNISYISSEGRILFSTNNLFVGNHTYEIPQVGNYIEFNENKANYSLEVAKENKIRYYINTQVISDDKGVVDGYLFVKVRAGKLIADNITASWGFYLLFFIFAVDVIPLILRFVKKSIVTRLAWFNNEFRNVALGNLDVDDTQDTRQDELAGVRNDFIKIVKNLRKTSEFAKQIEKRNFDFEHQPLSDKDELSLALLNLRDNLAQAMKDEEKRKQEDKLSNWATQGIAKFSEILRQDNDNLEKLGLNIISNLVDYLGANQAGFFLVSDEKNVDGEPYIDLKASFAYNREKHLNSRIEWGVGILGNCIQEGKTLYMTNIPDNYINITSGLGDANPRCLLIVPLLANKKTYGAIELASFNEFEQYKIDFVNRLSETIASTIASVNINIQTTELLASTKEQSERIMQQEEEMRQNMEELQATQDEMQRKQDQIKNLAQELISEEIEMREFIERIKKF